jgi:hypothetical protein
MSTEWKPGDVASFDIDGKRITAMRDNDGRWNAWDGGIHTWLGRTWDGKFEQRRLAVIDPEDREQVERLEKLVATECGWIQVGLDAQRKQRAEAFQTALREFANPTPPKPDEPMGDGAVVQDAMGYRWVRIASQNESLDSPPWRHRGHKARYWQHVNAVCILSEGVTP